MELSIEPAGKTDLPLVRMEFGLQRTVCGCAYCAAYCGNRPGRLVPADLPRLCPPGQNLFAWAEQHLRARADASAPTLVPARHKNGHCHWLFEGRCAVHADAPYGCAFFDSHMSEAEVDRRADAAAQALETDRKANGLYYQVWLHLKAKGLTAPRGDGEALAAEFAKILRAAARGRRRSQTE